MKILVTGGAGFIGANLCRFLLKKGQEVICVDNMYTGLEGNVTPLMENPNFKFIKHDIIEPLDIEVDQIYNLACPASPRHYQRKPIATTKCCTIGVINMLELAKKCNAKILQASTSEVYGDPEEHPQKETYRGNVNPIGIRACYDEGKRVAESLCMDYNRVHGVDIRIIRIFNTYGPYMDPEDGRVVSNFIMQALKGEPLTVYGDGKQTRSFQYVTDLLEAMYKMMGQDGFIGPVNTGNPDEFTMLELASKVLEVTGSDSELVFRPLPQDDPVCRKPDISLAKEKLGWVPKVKLDNGLKDTVEYFKKVI